MKKRRLTLFALSFVLTAITMQAQVNLPLNSSGKVEIADIVQADSTTRFELYDRASGLLAELAGFVDKFTITEQDVMSGKIVCDMKFTLYTNQVGILKKEAGAITYKLTMDFKDNKYRYAFTDVIFHYIKQDRTYKMVQTGQTKGLEETKAGGWQKAWNHYRATTSSKIGSQTKVIITRMKEKKKAATPANAAETKKLDW
jgi:hypothetical protein